MRREIHPVVGFFLSSQTCFRIRVKDSKAAEQL
jgi:hypothetical protein